MYIVIELTKKPYHPYSRQLNKKLMQLSTLKYIHVHPLIKELQTFVKDVITTRQMNG